jgi:hypothetical protein
MILPDRRQSPLDGLMMVVGDFNCDSNSVTARLLTTGKSPYGNLKDRNYKANVSKASASQMRYGYRFQNVYDHHADDKYSKNNNNNSSNTTEPESRVSPLLPLLLIMNENPWADQSHGEKRRRECDRET